MALLAIPSAFAGDAATLVSVSLPAGTQVMPRSFFSQTWTIQNTGTTTWSATQNGYTLNLQGLESLGATATFTNQYPLAYSLVAIINSGASVPPGSNATFTMNFIAPEAPGTYTDSFQLNGTSNFGPVVTCEVVVEKAGSTNQYDRARAVSYANNYIPYFVSDGCFWTNGSDFTNSGITGLPTVPVPTYVIGDDCAHFVSSCIGSEPHMRGGGLNIASRAGTYGEPGAQRLIYTNLISEGWATEVYSLSQMAPGDVIGWNWEGDTNTADIDHVTLYLGNGLIGAHAESHLGVGFHYYATNEPGCVFHLIHILDAPTLNYTANSNNFVLSWTTNWTAYSLYSSSSLASNATWSKVSTSPKKNGNMNVLTNTMSSGPVFYRLVMP
jgi:Ig-like domain from next to BRCA1 gene